MIDYEEIEKELVELSLTRQMATEDQMKAATTAQYNLLGVAYLMCSDKHRFGKWLRIMTMHIWLVGRSIQNL